MRQHQHDHNGRHKVHGHQCAHQRDDHAQQLVGQSGVEPDVLVDGKDQQKRHRELERGSDNVLILAICFNDFLSYFKNGCQHVCLPFRNFL